MVGENLGSLKKDLDKLANPGKVKILQKFFKTGKGEYAEGDVFLGITVPAQRQVAKKYKELGLKDVQELLNSKIHEHRLTALFILIDKYKNGSEKEKNAIYKLYLKNIKNINNWDLVDSSAPNILGEYLLKKPRTVLYKMAKSKNLWQRRIAILSTFAFIKKGDFSSKGGCASGAKDAIKISEMLLDDKHDLIHKAVGWMLREVGKKDQKVLEEFLEKYSKKMPRTMLRYSIEKLPPALKEKAMKL